MQTGTSDAGRIPCARIIAARTSFTVRRRSGNRVARIATTVGMLIVGLALAAPAAAEGVVGTVPGRVGGSTSALVAIVGVVAGTIALRRSSRALGPASGRDGAIVALVLGVVGLFLAAVHLATATGGVGTGSGKAGAVVAAVLGVIGGALGRAALARSGRAAAE